MKRFIAGLFVITGTAAGALVVNGAEAPAGDMHHQPVLVEKKPDAAGDSRVFVALPEEMRAHMLSNMRDHLLALQQIQGSLADGRPDESARIAEERLGMSAMKRHGGPAMAPYMPEGMRSIGGGMHRAASRFAVVAGESAQTGDLAPALTALTRITAQCVACHSAYRVH
jgi:hypothetical protein